MFLTSAGVRSRQTCSRPGHRETRFLVKGDPFCVAAWLGVRCLLGIGEEELLERCASEPAGGPAILPFRLACDF